MCPPLKVGTASDTDLTPVATRTKEEIIVGRCLEDRTGFSSGTQPKCGDGVAVRQDSSELVDPSTIKVVFTLRFNITTVEALEQMAVRLAFSHSVVDAIVKKIVNACSVSN